MIRTAIIGAGGYTGAELVSILAFHPGAVIVGLFGSDARAGGAGSGPVCFSDLHPRWRGLIDCPVQRTTLETVIASRPDAVFLATPHEVSHELAPALLGYGIIAIDLSAAFRLRDPAAYAKHYGFTHEHPQLLEQAVYGLPERHETALREGNLIAVPGCYPTSIVLPLAPLVDAGAIDRSSPVIADCTSGVSGAGRTPSLKSQFCEVTYQPYGVLSHRHTPEIIEQSGAPVIFTPHLAPFDRGIVSTIHATLATSWTEEKVRGLLDDYYARTESPFVRLLPAGSWPSVGTVRGTNFCDIALGVDSSTQHLIVISAIDNLLKGAAGQAVQCFNVRFGLPHATGLLQAFHAEPEARGDHRPTPSNSPIACAHPIGA